MADDFEAMHLLVEGTDKEEFLNFLINYVKDTQPHKEAQVGYAVRVLQQKRLTPEQQKSIMILVAYGIGASIRVAGGMPFTFRALKIDRSSVTYDDEDGYRATGETVSMTTSNIDQVVELTKLQFLINHMIETIVAKSVSTKRDCYYMLKNEFQKYPWAGLTGQTESDRLIDTLERIIRRQRENINIIADPKGLIYGNITLEDEEGNVFSCLPREQSITGLAGQWSLKKHGIKAVIPIEKTGIFMDLKKLGVADKLGLGLIHLGGQPSRGCRALIRLLSENGIPVGVLTDFSPWSCMIAKSVISGSIKAAHLKGLHASKAEFLGIESKDVKTWLSGVWTSVQEPLTRNDEARARHNLTLPYMQDEYWTGENSWFLKNKRKTELEALGTAAGSPLKRAAFYEQYLSEKAESKLGIKLK